MSVQAPTPDPTRLYRTTADPWAVEQELRDEQTGEIEL